MNERSALAQLITNHFNLTELNTVLYDAGIDCEEVSGTTLSAKARESVALFYRKNRVPEFAKALAKRKPSIDFSRC